MTRRRKFLITVAIALPVAVVAAASAWRRVAVEFMSGATEREFRQSYAPGNASPPRLSQEEWAWRFGGRLGLARLQALAQDGALTREGRLLAGQLRDFIATGSHLPYLRSILDARAGRRHDIEPPAWPTIAIIEYIQRRDSR